MRRLRLSLHVVPRSALVVALTSGAVAHAATIQVTGLTDVVSNNGTCSLREAVRAANLNTASGAMAYETTYSIVRFNNGGSQLTVLVLQNPSSGPVAGEAHFWDSAGTLVATLPFTLGPKETLVRNTGTVTGASGVSGSITVAHDARYGELVGKTVTLELSTGFSFDSPMSPRVR
jgi:CSLREA domain-containing protein